MPSKLNELILNETRRIFTENSSAIFIKFHGFTQSDSLDIRAKVKACDGTAILLKNNITKLVLKDMDIEADADLLDGSTLALLGEDPAALAKVAVDFAKANDNKGESTGGVVDGKLVQASDIVALSKLPSREALLGQLAGVIAAPMSGLARVLNANLTGLATVLQAVKDQKEKEVA